MISLEYYNSSAGIFDLLRVILSTKEELYMLMKLVNISY